MIDKITVEEMHKRIKRAGTTMHNVLITSFFAGKLSAEGALTIYNTYAITLPFIILIAASHCLEVDEEGFNELLEEQEKEHKRTRQC